MITKRKYTNVDRNGKPFKGRPTVAEGYFKDAYSFEYFKDFHFATCDNARPSRRAMTNGIYMQIGCDLIKKYLNDFPVLSVLLPKEKKYYYVTCTDRPRSGILEQIGRMKQQDGLPDEKILEAATAAAISKQEGVSSKTIEKELRKLRLTGELNGEKW